jgi:adenylate kinase
MLEDRKVELTDATHIFTAVWDKLEAKHGRTQLHFPKEIMWLGGAPGAGKGTNTPFIIRERGMTSEPIVMSSLLNSPVAERLKKDGYLVGDREAIDLLLEELLKEEYESGVVVDGFPRTKVQVDVVRMLFQKMQELRAEFFNMPIGPRFRQPIFRITILHVREAVSIERQLSRGRDVQAHNAEVEKTGEGVLMELRSTDLDPEMAQRRYKVFMAHTFEALTSLRDSFHYHLIGANGDIASVEEKINKGFQYQSSLELGPGTYDSIHNIPVVDLLTLHTRQLLVKRPRAQKSNRQHQLLSRRCKRAEVVKPI